MTKLGRGACLLFVVAVFGYGCYDLGYTLGYVAAIQWAKGVNFDQ